jgi:hypothetical protein
MSRQVMRKGVNPKIVVVVVVVVVIIVVTVFWRKATKPAPKVIPGLGPVQDIDADAARSGQFDPSQGRSSGRGERSAPSRRTAGRGR